MARVPRGTARSARQVAAGRALAAAGRKAQALAHKPPTQAQHRAALKFAAAGRAAQAVRRRGKLPPAAKKRAAVAPDDVTLFPGSAWPAGCNDTYPTCAAVAVACHLYSASGIAMADTEVLRLHQMAGGETGACISDVLETLSGNWMSFSHGRARLLSFFRTDEQLIVSGLVVGVQLGHEGHAVLSAPGGMVSWGRYLPWQGEPREAWAIEWAF